MDHRALAMSPTDIYCTGILVPWTKIEFEGWLFAGFQKESRGRLQ